MLGFPVKVAKGAPQPILRDLYKIRLMDADEAGGLPTHGQTGMGNVVLPECGEPFYEKNAVETIWEAVSYTHLFSPAGRMEDPCFPCWTSAVSWTASL